MDCNKVKLIINTAVSWILSLSLALAPFASRPVLAQDESAAEPTFASAPESDFSQVRRLLADFEGLMDRALYPTVPRLGRTGIPSPNELLQLQARLTALKQSYDKTLLKRIAETTTPSDETDLVLELNMFYTAAQRLEGLKIWLGQPSRPETWDSLYSLSFPISSLSQMIFIAVAATNSEHFAALPLQIFDLAKVENQQTYTPGFLTSLETTDRLRLRFRINPEFVETFEQLSLISNPSTRNVATFALWWSAHRMYDVYGSTIDLLRWPLANIEEPSRAFRNKFVSFRVKRDIVLRRLQKRAFETSKPAALKALLDAIDAAQKADRGWLTDLTFLTDFNKMVGLNPPTDLAPIHKSESNAVILGIASFLNLTDMSHLNEQSEQVLYNAFRMALRWRYLINPDYTLSDAAKIQLAEEIDFRAKTVTDEILQSTRLHADLEKVQSSKSYANLQTAARTAFQMQLEADAQKMRSFTTQDINISYLLTAESPYIAALSLSPFVQTLIQNLGTEKSYAKASETYQKFFFTYLQGFSSPSETLTDKSSLKDYVAYAKSAKWTPQQLTGAVDAKYIQDLNQDTKAREKDLADLIAIGKLLKFDIAQDASPQTVETLVKDGWFRKERQAYLAAMKDDLARNTPLLGSQLPYDYQFKAIDEYQTYSEQPMGQLWEYLADEKNSVASKITTTDTQILNVLAQIKANNATLDRNLAKMESTPGDGLDLIGPELQTLMLKSSQLSGGLQMYSGFDNYYGGVRSELVEPGLVHSEWEQFSSWAFKSQLVMVGLLFLGGIGNRFYLPLGEAVTEIGRLLAPIFGPKFVYLNRAVLATIGVSLVQGGVSGWITEPRQLNTLNDFFACGAGQPCVALYSDLEVQQRLVDSHRMSIIQQIVPMLLLYMGQAGYGISRQLMGANPLGRAESLKPKLAILGLDENSPLSPQMLGRAETAAKVKAQALKNPAARQAAQLYVAEAHRQIEEMVWREATKWNRIEQRFSKTIRRLGLNTRTSNWRDLRVLNEQTGNLIANYQAGRVPTFDYLELKSDLFAIISELLPVYKEMEKNPGTRQFMERVWDSSRGISSAQIEASVEYFRSPNYLNFMNWMDDFLDAELSRNPRTVSHHTPAMEKLIQRLNAILAGNPEVAQRRLENILRDFKRQAWTR